MNDDFWVPVFARLHENLDLLKIICADTHDNDLLNWARQNPVLWGRCARYMHRKKIGNRNGLIAEMLKFAEKDAALRRLIFFNWVEKNKQTMDFVTLPANAENFQKLCAFEFGKADKIRILAEIDPRDNMKDYYQRCLDGIAEPVEPPSDLELSEKPDDSTVPGLREHLEKCRAELKELQKLFNSRATEITGLQNALAERDQSIAAMNLEIDRLQLELQKAATAACTHGSEQILPAENLRQQLSESRFRQNTLSLQLEQTIEELTRLKLMTNRKEAAIAGLREENTALKEMIKAGENNDRALENLREMVQRLATTASEKRVCGQIVRIEGKRNNWFLRGFDDELYELAAETVRNAGVCEAEFCCGYFAENGTATALESLENDKRNLIGYIEENDGELSLCDGESSFPLRCESETLPIDRPFRGIFLSANLFRPAGIYAVFAVNFSEKTVRPTAKARPDSARPRIEKQRFDFAGKKLLIFGGDYVGNDYARVLGQHNLDITWAGGFQGIGSFREGLAAFDLVVVILRQVSHTVLREIVQATNKHKAPLLYCKKRGISGLLEELKQHFSIS